MLTEDQARTAIVAAWHMLPADERRDDNYVVAFARVMIRHFPFEAWGYQALAVFFWLRPHRWR